MTERVSTKKRFLERIGYMKYPVLYFSEDPYWELLNVSFFVKDNNDFTNKFELPGCRLSRKEYLRGDIKKYEERELRLTNKYKKWMSESK